MSGPKAAHKTQNKKVSEPTEAEVAPSILPFVRLTDAADITTAAPAAAKMALLIRTRKEGENKGRREMEERMSRRTLPPVLSASGEHDRSGAARRRGNATVPPGQAGTLQQRLSVAAAPERRGGGGR